MGEYWAVACEYWLINRTIVGEMHHLARCINFNSMGATSAWILLGSASPIGLVSISQQGNQWVQIIINLMTDSSRYRIYHISKWESKERQRLLLFSVWQLKTHLVAIMYKRHIGSLYMQKRQRDGHCPIQNMRFNRESTIFSFPSWAT